MATVTDILMSPARIFYAPVGTALPVEDTVAYGAAWSSWTDLAYTLTPITVGYKQDIYKLEVEQLTAPVLGMISSEEMMLETTLAEINVNNLALAFGGTTSVRAATTALVGKSELASGGSTTLRYWAWGLEGLYVDAAGAQFPVRVLIYKGTAMLNGTLQWSKKAPVGIPLQIQAWLDTSQTAGQQLWKIQKVTAAKTT